MKFYDCLVKTGVNGLTHVPKKDIPAAEVVMLQFIHGSENVVNIKEVNDDSKPKIHFKKERDGKESQIKEIQPRLSQTELRERLEQRYGLAKVKILWGNSLSSQKLPEHLDSDLERMAKAADALREESDDGQPKRIM